MGFLDKFMKNEKAIPKHGSRQTISHDKWDKEDLNAMMGEMKEFSKADDRLSKLVTTGHEAMNDTFFSLVKANPELLDTKDIRPSYLINHAVMGEAMGLKEWQELRLYSTGDTIATGLACVAMEPELEVLFDKLEDERNLAEQIEQQLQQMEGLEGQASSLEDMMAEALAAGQTEEAKNFQDQAARIAEQMEKLREQIEKNSQDLEGQLHSKSPQIKESLKKAASEASEDAEGMDSVSQTWGLDQGQLQRLPAERRIALAKKIKSQKFKRLAQLIGPMTRLAMAEQQRKIIHAPDEVYDIEFGDDLARLLPQEILFLDDEEEGFELDWYRRFFDKQLLQYKLQGVEKLAKGGIIFCEDGSGSMSGDREVWAKAVGLALLQIARVQNREFYGIHFGGPGEYQTFDFDTKTGSVEVKHRKAVERFDAIDGVIAFAETFFGGGTCYLTPLSAALDKLREQHARFGAIKGDIVFVTDGECGVPEKFLEEFKAEKERLQFKMYGILIGYSNEMSEPLNTLCDGKVIALQNLLKDTNGDKIRTIFRDL
jgi:uncharacterized protein with von Willebrand factor type A (vWA) domain